MMVSEVAKSCPTLCNAKTAAYQVPQFMGFSRQEYWSGLPFPFPGDLPDPGIEPRSPALQVDALPSEPPGNMINPYNKTINIRKQFTVCLVSGLKSKASTKQTAYQCVSQDKTDTEFWRQKGSQRLLISVSSFYV